MVSARQIGIEGEGSLKRSVRKIEIRGRIRLELIEKPRGASKPRPSGSERRIGGNAYRKQVTRLFHRVDGLEFSEFLRTQEGGVGGLVDPGFADDGNRESVPELGNGLNGLATTHLSNRDDDVCQIRIGHKGSGPE